MSYSDQLDEFIQDLIANFADVRDDHEDVPTDRRKMLEIFQKKTQDAKIAAMKCDPRDVEVESMTHFITALDHFIRYAAMEVRYMDLRKKERRSKDFFPVESAAKQKKAVH